MKDDAQPITIGQVSAALDAIAPPELAQAWDNVGLLVGDREMACRRVLLCIDLMPAVLEESIEVRAELIVAYHPPLFRPITRLCAQSSETDAVVYGAIRAGISLYSPHTALDAASGGTNDVMAELCGLVDLQPFEHVRTSEKQFKLVTFVPPDALEALAAALFDAGAGRIGDYEQCSYRLNGEGTFFGTPATNPQVGQRGRLERVAEVRLETIAPERRLPEIVAALRKAHPYEEPAFDVYPLEGEPVPGIGRVGKLPADTTLASLARRLIDATGSRVACAVGDPQRPLLSAAVCVGAAGRLPFEKLRSREVDVVITGEMRHHEALTVLRRGKCAVVLGHWESERPVLPRLADRLRSAVPQIEPLISRRDTGPFQPA